MAQYIKKKKGYGIRFYLDEKNNKGQQERIYLKGPYNTKKDANNAMREYLTEHEKTKHLINGNITMTQYCEIWFDNYVIQNVKPNTQKRYGLMIKNHIIPNLGEINIKDIKPITLQNYYTHLTKQKEDGGAGLSGTTALKHHRLLHQMFKHAVGWQMILYNYAESVQPPKATTAETKFITEEQFYSLLDIFRNTDYFIPVLLAGTTGMREGEICGLQDSNVSLNNNEIYVKHNLVYVNKKWILDSTKTHRSTRPVYIFPDVIPILKKYVMNRKEQQLKYGPKYINSGFFCRRSDGNFINPITLGKRFTIEVRKRGYDISFHGLRHTHATILFSKGKDLKTVADRLGHSTTKITTDTYIHSSIESQKRLLGDIKLPGLGTF